MTYRNSIRFNCSNFRRIMYSRPPHCYNCANRSGFPSNLGGDDSCENFQQIEKKKGGAS